MIVRCPQCSTRFRLREEQTAGRDSVRLRCTSCSLVFSTPVERSDEPPIEAAPAPMAPPPAPQQPPPKFASTQKLDPVAELNRRTSEREEQLSGAIGAVGAFVMEGGGPPRRQAPSLPGPGTPTGDAPSVFAARAAAAQNLPQGAGFQPQQQGVGSAGPSTNPAYDMSRQRPPSALDQLPAQRIEGPESGDWQQARRDQYAREFEQYSNAVQRVDELPGAGRAANVNRAQRPESGRFDPVPAVLGRGGVPAPAEAFALPPQGIDTPMAGVETLFVPRNRRPSSTMQAVPGPDPRAVSPPAGHPTISDEPPQRRAPRPAPAPNARDFFGGDDGKIDPVMEFQDLFRDDDGNAPSRRYVSESLAAGAARVERRAEPSDALERLDGLHQHRVETSDDYRAVDSPLITQTEESSLLDLALAASGFGEPADEDHDAQASPEVRGVSRLIKLDIAGDAERRREVEKSSGTGGRIAVSLLIIVLTLVGTLAFIASRNDWLLDLSEMDQMLGVAFRGESYEPRLVSIVRIVETEERWVEETLDAMPEEQNSSLEPMDLDAGRYINGDGVNFVIVEGTVANRSEATYRNIFLVAELLDTEGNVVTSRTVPAGSEIDQPMLERIQVPADLDRAYTDVVERAEGLDIAAGQRTRFTAVFMLDDDMAGDELTYAVRPFRARQRRDACWGTVAFSPEEASTEVRAPDGALPSSTAQDQAPE